MNLSNYYWAFKSAIPPRICDDIIKYALSQKETMARTGGFDGEELNEDQIKVLSKHPKRVMKRLMETSNSLRYGKGAATFSKRPKEQQEIIVERLLRLKRD